MKLELHQLDRRYEELRVVGSDEESRLIASLAKVGQQNPVLVIRSAEPGRYRLIDGFRRVRALRALSRDTVEALVLDLNDTEALLFWYRQRVHGRVAAIEEAWLLRELIEAQGLSQTELAIRLSRSLSWVSRRLALVSQLPASVQRQVRSGRFCAQAAMRYLVPLARAKPEQCERLVERLGPGKVSVRQMAALYQAWKESAPSERLKIVEHPRLYLKVEQEMSRPRRPEVGPRPKDKLLSDIELVAQLCFRIRRRLRRGDGSGVASLPETLAELWSQTLSAFESVNALIEERRRARP